jgi:hypothetical protein
VVLAVYCLAVILFCAAFYFAKLVATCQQVIAIAQTAAKTIVSKELDDDAKEKATQEAAVNMIKAAFVLAVKLAIVLGLTVLPLWAADYAGLASLKATIEFSLRLDVLLITTVFVAAVVIMGRKLFGSQ